MFMLKIKWHNLNNISVTLLLFQLYQALRREMPNLTFVLSVHYLAFVIKK